MCKPTWKFRSVGLHQDNKYMISFVISLLIPEGTVASGFSLCCVTLGVTHFAFQNLCLYQTNVFIYTSTVIALKTSHEYQLYKNKQKIHNQIWTFQSLETKSCIHMKCMREIFKRRKMYDCSATSSPHNANSLLSWSRPCWPNRTLHMGTYQCSLLIWFGLFYYQSAAGRCSNSPSLCQNTTANLTE